MSTKMLTITSNPNNILQVEHYLSSLLDDLKINSSKYPEILITLTEAVNNAIIHGNKNDETKLVTINCNTAKKGISFTVIDEGCGFDVEKVPNPTDKDRIEICGGRGVYIMSQLADKVKFKENQVELYFSL